MEKEEVDCISLKLELEQISPPVLDWTWVFYLFGVVLQIHVDEPEYWHVVFWHEREDHFDPFVELEAHDVVG